MGSSLTSWCVPVPKRGIAGVALLWQLAVATADSVCIGADHACKSETSTSTCCGVPNSDPLMRSMRDALHKRYELCDIVEMQLKASTTKGLNFDRALCVWPVGVPEFDKNRQRFLEQSNVPLAVQDWASKLRTDLEKNGSAVVMMFGDDGPRRAKLYVEEYRLDNEWAKAKMEAFSPHAWALTYDPTNGLAGDATAAKKYVNLPISGASTQLAKYVSWFGRHPNQALKIEEASKSIAAHLQYSYDELNDDTNTSVTSLSFRFANSHMHNNPQTDKQLNPEAGKAVEYRRRSRRFLQSIAPVLEEWIKPACSSGNSSGKQSLKARAAASWVACSEHVFSELSSQAFLNWIKYNEVSTGENYVTFYWNVRVARTGLLNKWHRKTCIDTTPPEHHGVCALIK